MKYVFMIVPWLNWRSWNWSSDKGEFIIEVSFADSSGPIGSNSISRIGASDPNTVSIDYAWEDAGFELITVTVDPANDINELDETNNSASKLYQVGDIGDMNALVIVSTNPARTW